MPSMTGREKLRRLERLVCTGLLAIAVSIGHSGPVLAVDGVIEINQESVIAAGGFPYVINLSGSYRLTGNLIVEAPDTNAIEITTSDVTLDLNGFTIRCRTAPLPFGLTCNGVASTGSGIAPGTTGVRQNITIKNGTIRDFAGGGVFLDVGLPWLYTTVTNIRAFNNGGVGLFVGAYAIVRDCMVVGNDGAGIQATDSLAVNNIVRSNSSIGVFAKLADGNLVVDNGGAGIGVSTAGNAYGNAIYGNSGVGLDGSEGARIVGNVVYDNGAGLLMFSDTGYGDNVIDSNGSTVSNGVELGTNLCDGSTTCP